MKEDLELTQVQMGILGSLVFLGLVLGSICSTFVNNILEIKYLLVMSMLGNGVGLLLFTLTRNTFVLFISRLMCGFFQIFLTIYAPIYCDCYCTEKSKPYMMPMVIIAGPLGVVFGYAITGTIIGYGYSWRISFVLQGLIMIASSLVLSIIPSSLVDIKEANALKREEKITRINRQQSLDTGDRGGTR